MGLFDFLDKDKRRAKKLERAVKRLCNAYAQSEDRMKSADLLKEDGSDEAICGLLKRFKMKASNQVVDEDEKQLIYGMVLDFDEAAVVPIMRFIRREDAILHPLRALSEILPLDDLVERLGQVLDEIGPEYVKNPERKLHIVQHLDELDDPRVVDILLPFSEDDDEGIRFQVLGALGRRGGERSHEALLGRLLTEEDESIRVRQQVCELLSETPHAVGEEVRETVSENLPDGWEVDDQGRIRRKRAGGKKKRGR